MIQVVNRESVWIHDDDAIVLGQLEDVEPFVASPVVVVGQMFGQALEVSNNSALSLPNVEHRSGSIVVGGIGEVDEVVGRIDEDVIDVEFYTASYDNYKKWLNWKCNIICFILEARESNLPQYFFLLPFNIGIFFLNLKQNVNK